MKEIRIPRDIHGFKAKLVGPFTTRQTAAVAVILAAGAAGYKFIYPAFGSVPFQIFIVIFALPAALFGWIKFNEVPFEKFALSAFISNFLSPKNRKYKSEIMVDKLNKDIRKADRERRAYEKTTIKVSKKVKKEKLAINNSFESYK